jgi:phosphatidate cytidylyltransferase
MSELTRRIIFAIVAIPVVVAVIYAGGAVLATLLSIIAAIAAWEFCRIARGRGGDPFDAVAIVAAAAVPLIVHGAYSHALTPTITHFVIAVLLLFASAIVLRGPERHPLFAVATTIFGVLYVSMIAYVYDIRYHDYVVDARGGTALVMLPILLTWTTDIGGYAFGRIFGERKLFPSVSPGKTIAGATGGIVLTAIVCMVYVRYVLHPFAQLTFTTIGAICFALSVSVVAQIGDLAESLLKREAGVKDSSQIIPGHGGVLDRFDSLLFVLPVAALLLGNLLIPAPT